MNNIALLMGLYPTALYDRIVADSLTMPQYAADALQRSIVVGISKKASTTVINLPYVGSFPKRYKNLFVPSINCIEFGAEIRSLRYCNLAFIKNLSRIRVAFKGLKAWASENSRNRTIIIYAIHLPFLIAVKRLKSQFPDIKVIQIVPDLPEFMNSRSSILQVLAYKRVPNYYHIVDGWILLSQFMVEKLNIIDKPWRVIEGIYNPTDTPIPIPHEKQETVFRIFYGGTLDKRYGIMNLVNAVRNSSYKNLELVLCGYGDSSEQISLLSQKDSRIVLLGSIPRNEVLAHIRSANLLVNPRTNEGDFTKYSFPSKTMEYLASGIPTLLYHLPGIPKEYYQYCFALEKPGVDTLQSEIERISQLPKAVLERIGREAKLFILNHKNPAAQCEKLVDLIIRVESKGCHHF